MRWAAAAALCGACLAAAPGAAGETGAKEAYLLQPGDKLEIAVWDQPDLSRSVEIRQEGTFPYPLLGDVQAAGLSIRELERRLQEELTREHNAREIRENPDASEPDAVPGDVLREGSVEEVSRVVYRLRNGDELKISVWGHNDLNQEVQIREDGAFSFPLIGRVQGTGRSLQEIEKEIQDRLDRDYIVNPQVNVQLLKAEFFVLGAIAKPGTYLTEGKMDLINAISQAGGATPEATREVEIHRGEGSERFRLRLNMDRVLQGTEPNITIMPRDTIFIREKTKTKSVFRPKELQVTLRMVDAKFVMLGEVESPGAMTTDGNMDLLTAISLAGGLTKFGSSRVEVIRPVEGGKRVIRANLDRILKGRDPNPAIFPRDTIYVRRRLF